MLTKKNLQITYLEVLNINYEVVFMLLVSVVLRLKWSCYGYTDVLSLILT